MNCERKNLSNRDHMQQLKAGCNQLKLERVCTGIAELGLKDD